MKRRLKDLPVGELRDRRALVRVDYNVPLEDGTVKDPGRIHATVPTLRYLLERGARPVLISHLGRPEGKPVPELSLAPVAPVLEGALGVTVHFVGAPYSDETAASTRTMPAKTVMLAENLRFHPGETENDPELAGRLARLGNLFVNDAFGACHRAHASTVGVTRHLRPAVAGLLVEAELEALDRLRGEVERPLVVVFGGAKISDKIGLLEGLAQRSDRTLVGGALANTFLRARGLETGRSRVEEEAVPQARSLLESLEDALDLPRDVVVEGEGGVRTVAVEEIGPEESVLDIGPRSRSSFGEAVRRSRTFFWNGPVGLFERPPFHEGTEAVARAAAAATRNGAFTFVGGGDTARAVREAGVADAVSYLSTGGGAALEYLEAGELPGIEALEDT